MGLFDKIFGEKGGEEAGGPAREPSNEPRGATAPTAGEGMRTGGAAGVGQRPANDTVPMSARKASPNDERTGPARAKGMPKPPPLSMDLDPSSRARRRTSGQTGQAGPPLAKPSSTLVGMGKRAPVQPKSDVAASDAPKKQAPAAYSAEAPTIIIEEDLALPEAEAEAVKAAAAEAEAAEKAAAKKMAARALETKPQRPWAAVAPTTTAEPQPSRGECLEALARTVRPQLAQIEQFGIALNFGCAPVTWTGPCRDAARALADAAQSESLQDVKLAASSLAQRLDPLAKSATGRISEQARRELSGLLRALFRFLEPALPRIPESEHASEQLFDALLRPLPGMHSLAMDRLRAAGFASLQHIQLSTPPDLSRRAQLEPGLAGTIITRVNEVAHGHGLSDAAEARAFLRDEARVSLGELEAAHLRFVEASDREDAPGKRAARRERDERLCDLTALLLQLGAWRAVEGLARGNFPERIAAVREEAATWSG